MSTSSRVVLLVDANEDRRAVLSQLFEALGYSACVADTVPSVLELASTRSPRVALVDISHATPLPDTLVAGLRLRMPTPSLIVALYWDHAPIGDYDMTFRKSAPFRAIEAAISAWGIAEGCWQA